MANVLYSNPCGSQRTQTCGMKFAPLNSGGHTYLRHTHVDSFAHATLLAQMDFTSALPHGVARSPARNSAGRVAGGHRAPPATYLPHRTGHFNSDATCRSSGPALNGTLTFRDAMDNSVTNASFSPILFRRKPPPNVTEQPECRLRRTQQLCTVGRQRRRPIHVRRPAGHVRRRPQPDGQPERRCLRQSG